MVVGQASEIVSIYRELASYPTPARGDIFPGQDGRTFQVQSVWSQRNLERKETTNLHRWHTVAVPSGDVISRTPPQEVKNESWNKLSPTGKLRAVVRTLKDKKNEDKQYLEIFDATRRLKTIDVLALEKHGKIIDNDGHFGSFEWSSSEGHILYMAEKKKPSTGGFFDAKAFKDVGAGGDEEVASGKNGDVKRGDEFVYVENWGEQLTERVCPVVCILDIDTNIVSVLESLPEDVSPGQAMWTPDDAGVIVCAWNHEPYRLGLKFCFQRKSFLYYLDIQKNSYEILSEEGRAVRFPRFSPDLSKLIYLDMPVGGAHNQCARLVKIEWPSRERKIVVDEVDFVHDPEFPGIYTSIVNRHIWFDDSIHLALETSWRSESAVIVVNTDTGRLQRVHAGSKNSSLGLFTVRNNYLLLSCSSISQPYHLLIGHVADPTDVSSCEWKYLDDVPEPLDWLTWQVILHKPSKEREHPKFPSLDYESILCLPTRSQQDGLPPLIVFPHGGPNVAFDTSFNNTAAFFIRCGYAVLMVNYRGSVGFGQSSILSLTGSIGTQDVRDVESAMVEVLAKEVADGNRLLVFGGSHGGYLTTHLIGQYPDTFKAASTRNPVVNLASKYSDGDSRDTNVFDNGHLRLNTQNGILTVLWSSCSVLRFSLCDLWEKTGALMVFAQSGLEFDYRSLADDKHLNDLWRRSPLSYVDQVKTPLLVMLGQDDKRVPNAQGIEYVRALKARQVPVRLQTYPGSNHKIDEVDAEGDLMVNTVLWFSSHI